MSNTSMMDLAMRALSLGIITRVELHTDSASTILQKLCIHYGREFIPSEEAEKVIEELMATMKQKPDEIGAIVREKR